MRRGRRLPGFRHCCFRGRALQGALIGHDARHIPSRLEKLPPTMRKTPAHLKKVASIRYARDQTPARARRGETLLLLMRHRQ